MKWSEQGVPKNHTQNIHQQLQILGWSVAQYQSTNMTKPWIPSTAPNHPPKKQKTGSLNIFLSFLFLFLFFRFLLFFEKKSHYVALAGLELTI